MTPEPIPLLGAAAGRERGEVERGGPALAVRDQRLDIVDPELEPGPSQQRVGLHAIHRQLPDPDLDQQAVSAQPAGRQLRLGARGERDCRARRDLGERRLDDLVQPGRRAQVRVVERDDEALVLCAQAPNEFCEPVRGARPQRRGQIAPGGLSQTNGRSSCSATRRAASTFHSREERRAAPRPRHSLRSGCPPARAAGRPQLVGDRQRLPDPVADSFARIATAQCLRLRGGRQGRRLPAEGADTNANVRTHGSVIRLG